MSYRFWLAELGVVVQEEARPNGDGCVEQHVDRVQEGDHRFERGYAVHLRSAQRKSDKPVRA